MKLFCIPYAGGGANIYRDWSGRFARYAEVVAVEYNGHGRLFCEGAYKSVDEAAEDIVRRCFADNDEPYVIYGHSLGSLVAFECAYKLILNGMKKPEHIILAGTRPPHLLYKDEKLTDLPEEVFMSKIFELGNTPVEVLENEELREMFYEILLSDMKMVDGYTHDASLGRLDIPVTVYTGKEDKDAPWEDMSQWGEYTDEEFTLKTFPGNHFFSFSDNVKELVYKEIERILVRLG